jgi:hypothetical protein
MPKFFLGIVSGVLITILGMMGYDWITKVDTNKIVAYLPYANDYFYSNGMTYKSASPSPANNMPRDIDAADPIPLDISKGEQKLTIGVKNINSRTVEDVRIFLELPEEFILTKCEPWQKYSEKNCSIGLGDINSGVGHNAVEPIFFKVTKTGIYQILYIITGRNINHPIKRVMTFNVYK